MFTGPAAGRRRAAFHSLRGWPTFDIKVGDGRRSRMLRVPSINRLGVILDDGSLATQSEFQRTASGVPRSRSERREERGGWNEETSHEAARIDRVEQVDRALPQGLKSGPAAQKAWQVRRIRPVPPPAE